MARYSPVNTQDTVHSNDVSRAFLQQARQLLKTEYLPKLERCLTILSDEQIWWRAHSESNSIGNLCLHLAGNARQWIVSGLGGEIDARARPQEFYERKMIPGSELLLSLRQTLEEVDTVLARFDLERCLEQHEIQGTRVTALEAIFHLTEHFSMHTGQIILLTKMLSQKDLAFYDFSTGAPVRASQDQRSE
ncbi:MAG: DinB family protein [Pyrinomonadaceae bacterium]